jgi:ABC-type uncharacterized transport system substrate-binding protein
MYREAAKYIDRIVKGARPADLPVEEPTQFTLVVNQRSAKLLQVLKRLMLGSRALKAMEPICEPC